MFLKKLILLSLKLGLLLGGFRYVFFFLWVQKAGGGGCSAPGQCMHEL